LRQRQHKLAFYLFPAFLLLVFISLLLQIWYTGNSWREFYYREKQVELHDRAHMLESQLSRLQLKTAEQLHDFCLSASQASGMRITIVREEGLVLGDSHNDPKMMDNHADRPEIILAMEADRGSAIRYSHTLEQEMMYLAIAIVVDTERLIMRVSLPLTTLQQALSALQTKTLLGGLIVMLVTALLSLFFTRRIARPLERMQQGAEQFAGGDLHHQLMGGGTAEIDSLATSLNLMARQLDERIRTVVEQRNEQEAVLSSMTEGVIAVDRGERILSFNRAAATMFDIDRDQTIGCLLQEAIRNSRLGHFVTEILADRNTDRMSLELPGPPRQHLNINGARLQDASGQPLGAVIVLNDITRLHQLEKVRREFIANVSHELRTPITSIMGFVETLQENRSSSSEQEVQRFLEIIHRQSRRMNAIVQDLLELTRLENLVGSPEVQLDNQPIRPLLQDLLQEYNLVTRQKGLRLRLDFPEGVQAAVDASRLQQAVSNLLDNAIKYSGAGGEILVTGEIRREHLSIHIQDNGSGIEPQHHSRLFERFYRVDTARSRELGGTGLGLAIVKHIAGIHNGSVEVESTPGEGSTFTITIPV
jgi:two-component system, OmpR family, phosphate regulon sensor histidine kinase PhoR